MNTSQKVIDLISGWKQAGITLADLTVKIAEACLGWPYVWGGYGQICNSSNRRSYAERSSCPASESAVIISGCQILRQARGSCDGCKFYPGGSTRFFDCRGFTRWVLQQSCDWTLQGAGATSQWNTAGNWKAKGSIKDIPKDVVCCVFMQSGDKMSHTGLHVGGGQIIHCSGTVKRGTTSDKGWTHYAIPVCMEGEAPAPTPGSDRPTLRRGSSGEYVTLMQTKLIQRGYSLAPYGADGKFGNTTEMAVRGFQRDHNLVVDGICGRNTWAALDDGKTVFYTVRIEHLSKTVAEDLVTKYGGVMTAEGSDA